MSLPDALADVLNAEIPAAFEMFGRQLDLQWIEDALEETGAASVRKRKLPAELVVWLVIGMATFRDRSNQEVVNHLGLVSGVQSGRRSDSPMRRTPASFLLSRHLSLFFQ